MLAGAAAPHSQALGFATLISWLFTAGVGAYMLRSMIARGGLRRQRASKDGLPPGFLFGHFILALTGLVLWISYLAAGSRVLAWVAVGLLMPAIGLGISTVILWTPFPDPGGKAGPGQDRGPGHTGFPGGMLAPPAEDALARKVTDELLASAATNEVLMGRLVEEVVASARADPVRAARRPKGHLAALVPVGHGLGALATFVLAVMAAALGT